MVIRCPGTGVPRSPIDPPLIRILSIAGTRPEAIKLAPLALAAARRPGIEHRLVGTGQHDHLFHQVIGAFGVTLDRDLGLRRAGQSIDELAAAVETEVKALAHALRPHLLVVQGDTTTAWAAARAGHSAGLAVGHVEAGLRSHDPLLPWPEERNRVEIDALATLLFAPTALSAQNLRAEPAVRGHVTITGNTGIDALLAMRDRLPTATPTDRRLILATCHRRENMGSPLDRICDALLRLAARGDVVIRLPVHPNPAIRCPVLGRLGGVPGIELIDPLGYPEMVAAMASATLILSDSGGLQEEAPALGVPLLVLRDNSERPEAFATGNLALVGSDADRIVAAATRLLDDPAAHAAMAHPAFPYGDGTASEKILDAIEQHFMR